jgi:hypothetical protein
MGHLRQQPDDALVLRFEARRAAVLADPVDAKRPPGQEAQEEGRAKDLAAALAVVAVKDQQGLRLHGPAYRVVGLEPVPPPR